MTPMPSCRKAGPRDGHRPPSLLQGQRRASAPRRLHVCRQSTIKQVLTNTESTLRQYDLRGRAIAFGWSSDQIIVIDIDQAHSGASAADREGFQQLVADVGMGKAGIVLSLECSRLARNNADWHRLLEICALSGTLICDEDGLYDPRDFNDRMLLGMNGQLSEAELHFLRSRMRGGILSKARRGELITPLPSGWPTTPPATPAPTPTPPSSRP
jgi:DNA invertase Pin-like site-specific DNA recombinase